jgi:PHD/YefM family antitoxin component YafN of YafNO toxin-antitoxin module
MVFSTSCLDVSDSRPLLDVLTTAEIKRRGIAAIEQALQHGLVHLLKRNQPAAVIVSEQHYRQLQRHAGRAVQPGPRHWSGC